MFRRRYNTTTVIVSVKAHSLTEVEFTFSLHYIKESHLCPKIISFKAFKSILNWKDTVIFHFTLTEICPQSSETYFLTRSN